MAQQVQIKTSINQENIAPGSLESRFIDAYQRMIGSKSAHTRDLVLVGYLMRELGLSQRLLDLELSGQLDGLSHLDKKKAICQYLFGEFDTSTTKSPDDSDHSNNQKMDDTEPHQDRKKQEIGNWGKLSS